MAAATPIGPRSHPKRAGSLDSWRMSASAYSKWPAIHIASGAAARLNAKRRGARPPRASRTDKERQSSATASVPAAGPATSNTAKVKVSAIEKLTGIAVIRSVVTPLSSVSPATSAHRQSVG